MCAFECWSEQFCRNIITHLRTPSHNNNTGTGDMPEDSQHRFDNLPEMINNTLHEFDRAVFSIVQNLANDQLTKLSYDCGTPSPTPTPTPNHHSKVDFSWFFDNPGPFGVLISLLIILILSVVWCSYRRYKYDKRKARKRQETVMSASRGVDELLGEYESDVEEVEEKRGDEEPLLTEESNRYDCLAFEPCVPVYARYGVPIIIIGSMVMLVNANISLGAAVTAYLTILDQTEKIPDLFKFTLKSSIQEMWNAGVYPLSILIAVASGGWPYLKLALCLLVWLLPRKYLDLQGRNRFLNILEQTGKWSLIDTYVRVVVSLRNYTRISHSYKKNNARIHTHSNTGTCHDVRVLSLSTQSIRSLRWCRCCRGTGLGILRFPFGYNGQHVLVTFHDILSSFGNRSVRTS